MFVFTTAKSNLLAKFETRFSPNQKGEGYVFYPKEYEQGYACSETDYQKFTADFQKFLKQMTRTMWIWFLTGMPVIIGLAIWQDYEFNTLEKLSIIMFPFPFLTAKGWRVYNAPDILTKGERPIVKQKNEKQVFETRISGMSWIMLVGMVVVPIIGVYVFLNYDSLASWQLSLGLCFLLTLAIFGIYFIFRKWKLE